MGQSAHADRHASTGWSDREAIRPDSTDSAPPIDLPLHDREPEPEPVPEPERAPAPAPEVTPEPLFQHVAAPASGGRGFGLGLGMLVIGLLAGFGGGFLAGQRLTPPPPPRAVDVPRPVAAPPVAPAPPAPVVPAQNYTEAPVVEAESGIGDRGSGIGGASAADLRSPVPDPRSAIPGTVQFDSRPPGATIYVDEIRIGVTPITMNNVAPGTHQVRMELLGHQTWRTTVTVDAGAQHRVGASLE